MLTVKDLIGSIKERNVVIVGAGASIKEKYNQIDKFITDNNAVTFGINNATSCWAVNYGVWTNTQRFRTYGKNISPESKLLLGHNIPLKIINGIIGNKEYFLINYTDMNKDIPIRYKNGKIYGYYRTAGCLSIMIAHIMGAKKISIVGMDGYSLYKEKDLINGDKFQHCYTNIDGTGYTDTADYKTCVKKDKEINNVLCNKQRLDISEIR